MDFDALWDRVSRSVENAEEDAAAVLNGAIETAEDWRFGLLGHPDTQDAIREATEDADSVIRDAGSAATDVIGDIRGASGFDDLTDLARDSNETLREVVPSFERSLRTLALIGGVIGVVVLLAVGWFFLGPAILQGLAGWRTV